MRKYIGLVLLVFLVSCKAKKAVVTKAPSENEVTAEKIITSHYDLKNDFKTLYLKSDVKYRDDNQSQNVTAEIKIQKNEKILLSIRFLGITMAKALITPSEVKYYEKINGNYFEGDFSTLSKWLGTDLDFYKIQNLLIGEALEDLKKGKYDMAVENNLYRLNDLSDEKTEKVYFLENPSLLVKKQEITQPSKNRKLKVNYNDYKSYSNAILPSILLIEASQNNKNTSISISNNTTILNQEMSFPYKTPEGYTRIIID